MTTLDPTEPTKRFADAALAAMTRLGIAPTPSNYLIWHSHCSGSYPELSRRLRAVEMRGVGFSDELLAELHEQFFGTGRQVRLLDETCERIETTMAQLLFQIGGMTRDAGSYGDKLARLGDALNDRQQSRERQERTRPGLHRARRGRRRELRQPHGTACRRAVLPSAG